MRQIKLGGENFFRWHKRKRMCGYRDVSVCVCVCARIDRRRETRSSFAGPLTRKKWALQLVFPFLFGLKPRPFGFRWHSLVSAIPSNKFSFKIDFSGLCNNFRFRFTCLCIGDSTTHMIEPRLSSQFSVQSAFLLSLSIVTFFSFAHWTLTICSYNSIEFIFNFK